LPSFQSLDAFADPECPRLSVVANPLRSTADAPDGPRCLAHRFFFPPRISFFVRFDPLFVPSIFLNTLTFFPIGAHVGSRVAVPVSVRALLFHDPSAGLCLPVPLHVCAVPPPKPAFPIPVPMFSSCRPLNGGFFPLLPVFPSIFRYPFRWQFMSA